MLPFETFFERASIPEDRLLAVAKRHAPTYATASPFPHAVIDGLFDPAVLDDILAEFPEPGEIDWIQFDAYHQVKLASRGERELGPRTRALLHWFNSQPFVRFLEELTGITGLIPDPHLDGGGLHQILPGGKLGVHADFNRHLGLQLDRRLNALIYLNHDWRDEWKGHFELWTRDMTSCARRVAPAFNRLVVFSTTDTSFHGHPDPLECPPDRRRRSIALYYYTNGRPDAQASGTHSTLFQMRPGERVSWDPDTFVRRLIPPVLRDLRDMVRARGRSRPPRP